MSPCLYSGVWTWRSPPQKPKILIPSRPVWGLSSPGVSQNSLYPERFIWDKSLCLSPAVLFAPKTYRFLYFISDDGMRPRVFCFLKVGVFFFFFWKDLLVQSRVAHSVHLVLVADVAEIVGSPHICRIFYYVHFLPEAWSVITWKMTVFVDLLCRKRFAFVLSQFFLAMPPVPLRDRYSTILFSMLQTIHKKEVNFVLKLCL